MKHQAAWILVVAGGLLVHGAGIGLAARGEARPRTASARLDSLGIAVALESSADTLRRAGRDSVALAGLTLAGAIRERRLPEDSLGFAGNLWMRGRILSTLDPPAARPLLERSLAIREQVLGPDHLDVATTLTSLGVALINADKRKEAQARFERALVIREKALGPTHVDVAQSVDYLAQSLRMQGDYAGAEPLLRRALEIDRRARGDSNTVVAARLSNLGNVLRRLEQYPEALEFLRQSMELREKLHGPDAMIVGNRANDVAVVLQLTGDYLAAQPLYERALSIWEKAEGPESPDVAVALNNLGALLREEGDYAAARPVLARALAIREKALAPDDPWLATSLRNMARVMSDLGDTANVRSYFERSLSIRESNLGPEHPDLAAALIDIGNFLNAHGQRAEAEQRFRRAVTILEKRFGPVHAEVANAKLALATCLADAGDTLQALALVREGLAVDEQVLGKDHVDVARALELLAKLEDGLGRSDEAVADQRRGLAIYEKALGPRHPEVGGALARLALYERNASHADTAMACALRAESIGRDHLRLTTRSVGEQAALRYSAVRSTGLDLALSLAAERPSATDLWAVLDALVRSRGVVLDEIAARHRQVLGAANASVALLAQRLTAARARFAHLSIRGPGDEAPGHYRKQLDDAYREMDRAERSLLEKSVEFRREIEGTRIGLDQVAKALPKHSVLLSLVRFERTPGRGAAAGPPDSATTWYAAFTLKAGAHRLGFVLLGEAAAIDQAVANWRAEAGRRPEGEGAGRTISERACLAMGERLRRLVWTPLPGDVRNAKLVFVVPDGDLNLVSFAALPAGENDYLVNKTTVFYSSTERDVAAPPDPIHPGGGLLAFGAPDFDRPPSPVPASAQTQERVAVAYRGQRSNCGEFQAARFSALPGSAAEVEGILGAWRARRADARRPGPTGASSGAGGEASSLLGSQASEAAFKLDAPGRNVLHLATHGFFLGGHCAAATRQLSPLAPAGDSVPSGANLENPLVRCGLALAGANRRNEAAVGEEDGVLTAEEVASLDLRQTDWAVLSACETGLGDVRAGEGVLGLRRAFRVAGVHTLITSLWSVEDQATRQWMELLYWERFVRGLGKPESVRSASLQMIRDRRRRGETVHPFYWAAFVAAGDWR